MLETMLRHQPQDGACVFVDMNSFFASCEQQAAPELRSKPIAVVPFISSTTVVLAASIEAKCYGVKTGTNIGDAKGLCPQIVLLQANPRLYRLFHRRIMAELDSTRCQVVTKSIDEALLIVPHDLRASVGDLAVGIKRRVARIGEVLKCSVGIAPNMFLSKMGTSYQKPDGLVEIITTCKELHASDNHLRVGLEEFYGQLRLTDLHGISWRMERRLKDTGIYTPLEFYQAPYSLLKQVFGVNGEKWYLRLRGYEVDLKPTTRRMIGHQTTIVPDPATSLDQVLAVASQLTYRAATRLRAAGLAARGVVVGLRFADRTYWQRVYHGDQPFVDSATFFHHVRRMIRFRRLPKPVRLVSVTATDLIDTRFVSRRLFDPADRQERLSEALDDINFRYGEATIRTGRAFLTDRIHDAIGFGNASQNAYELPK